MSVTPKLHMLEKHLIPFIQKWKTGCGIYGEQGIESLHTVFNKAHRVYQALKPDEKRLESMLRNHVVGKNEAIKIHSVVGKKRKFIEKEE